MEKQILNNISDWKVFCEKLEEGGLGNFSFEKPPDSYPAIALFCRMEHPRKEGYYSRHMNGAVGDYTYPSDFHDGSSNDLLIQPINISTILEFARYLEQPPCAENEDEKVISIEEAAGVWRLKLATNNRPIRISVDEYRYLAELAEKNKK